MIPSHCNPFLVSIRRALALAFPLCCGMAHAATFDWNTTSGTWDDTNSNWTGGGAVWVDSPSNDARFANTAAPTTVTVDTSRTAGSVTIGNISNNYNFLFTSGSGATWNGTSLALSGSNANNSQDGATSHTVLGGNLNLLLSGNVTVGRGNLEFGGSGTYSVGTITTNADWGVFRMSGAAQVTATAVHLLHATGQGQTGSFDLNGGTLTTGQIRAVGTGDGGAGQPSAGAWSIRNSINGATVKASQDNPVFLQINASSIGVINATNGTQGNNVWLGSSGATFDSNGFNIGTATVLRDDTGAVGTLTKSGDGTLTLSGASTFTGTTTVQAGKLQVNGSLAAGSTVNVGGGASLGGTGTVNGPVVLTSGATPSARGSIDLIDHTFGLLSLLNPAGLALGGSTGDSAHLGFEVGDLDWDSLTLGSGVLTVNAGGATISISESGIEAGVSYELISFGSGDGAGFATGTGTTVGGLTLADPALTFGVTGELEVTSNSIHLVTSGASAPFTAYWSGVKGSSWTSIDGAEGNFTENGDGTDFVGAYPSSVTDVVFAANGNGAPANLTNTLGKDFTIYSLTFTAGTQAADISGANRLALSGGGVLLEDGNGGATLSMAELAPGQHEPFVNDSASDLLIDAVITGTGGPAISGSGTGATVFTAANTYQGGTSLDGGILRMEATGTLGATNGPLNIDAGIFDLNGTSQTVGAFGGAGGTVLNNATGTEATLTVGNGNGGGEFSGVLADHATGTGTLALTKSGTGTLSLSGTNTYSGNTTIAGGTLLLAADETIPDASVLEINNGGKLSTQAFSNTVAGLTTTAGNTNLIQNRETGGAGTGTLVIDTAGADHTFDGIIRDSFQSSGALALIKSGSGTQTVTATNNLVVGTSIEFSGGLTIQGGTFRLWDQGVTNTFYPNGKVISTFASDVTNHGTFALENTGAGNVTFARNISGSGMVTTSGLVTLAGANTYTGTTTVASGILSLTQPVLADGSAVDIAAGAKLNMNFAGTDTISALTLGGSTAANGTWGATGSGAANINDTFFSGSGVLQVGAPTAGYSSWAAMNAGGQGPDLDYDDDGVPNGVEYFMGATGSSFTHSPGIVAGKVTWPKDPAYVGTYTVQSSPDLITWTDVASTVVGNSVEYSVPAGMGGFFIRLTVTPD